MFFLLWFIFLFCFQSTFLTDRRAAPDLKLWVARQSSILMNVGLYHTCKRFLILIYFLIMYSISNHCFIFDHVHFCFPWPVTPRVIVKPTMLFSDGREFVWVCLSSFTIRWSPWFSPLHWRHSFLAFSYQRHGCICIRLSNVTF